MANKKLGIWGHTRPLLCENGGGFSLGRLATWLALAPAISLWWTGKDIQENHLYVLLILFAYNFAKKVPTFIALIKAWRGTD